MEFTEEEVQEWVAHQGLLVTGWQLRILTQLLNHPDVPITLRRGRRY